jgi:hypothetical protein
MGKWTKQTFFQRRTYKWPIITLKVLNIPDHKGNANQNYIKISPHSPIRIVIFKNTNNKCWWIWKGKGTFLYTLLLGMQISLTTVEISMEAPQKTKNRNIIQLNNTTPGYIHLGM